MPPNRKELEAFSFRDSGVDAMVLQARGGETRQLGARIGAQACLHSGEALRAPGRGGRGEYPPPNYRLHLTRGP